MHPPAPVGAYTVFAEVTGLEINRLSAAGPQRLSPVDPSTVPATPSAPSAASDRDTVSARQDRIDLSPAARELSAEPDAAREAQLAALRAQIESGAYRVDADGVARRIVAREDL